MVSNSIIFLDGQSVSLDVKEVIKTNKGYYIVIVETVRSFAEEALNSYIDHPKTKDTDREDSVTGFVNYLMD